MSLERKSNHSHLALRKRSYHRNGILQSHQQSLLTVVVPIYNEEIPLKELLPTLVASCLAHSWKLILVDDGSTDSTYQLLSSYTGTPHVRILRHKVNSGYGSALKTGIGQVDTPYLVTIDADGQHDITDIEAVFAFAREKDADLVVGARRRMAKGVSFRDAGKWLIRRFSRLLMPIPVSDLNSGFKLYRTELARKYISLCPDSMAFSDVITLIFSHQRRLVLEYPIHVLYRTEGKSTITTFTAIDTIMEITNMAMMFNPMRIFLPLSAACFLFGIFWGGRILLLGRGLSVGSLLAIVVGLWFFSLGLIAGQISAFRMNLLNADQVPPKV